MYVCMYVCMYTVCVRSVSWHQATNSDHAFDQHMFVCIRVCMCMYVYMYVCIQCVFLASVVITPQTDDAFDKHMFVCISVYMCMYVYMYVCIQRVFIIKPHTATTLLTNTRSYVHVYIYVCMNVCMYTACVLSVSFHHTTKSDDSSV